MATLRTMKATVKYQCPNWEFCNEMQLGGLQAGKRTCRFCQKSRGQAYCCLHDEKLNVHPSGTVDKCKACLGQTKGWARKKPAQVIDTVEDTLPAIQPKAVVKQTADSMLRKIRQLCKEGLPAELAIKIAHDDVVKGNL